METDVFIFGSTLEFRHPHFHGVKVTSYWIFIPVKEELSGGSIRRIYPEEVSGIWRVYPEDVSGGSIQYPEGVSRGSNRRMYTDQWNSFDHVNELTLVCAKLCLNLPGQLKNQFLQKWKKIYLWPANAKNVQDHLMCD